MDTHSLVWFAAGDLRLSENARAIIADPLNEVFASAASLWEIGIKMNYGKLLLHMSFEELVEDCKKKFAWLSIEAAHLIAFENLPRPERHRDPFDRMLVAQAMTESVSLISCDAALAGYPVNLLW